MKSLSSSLSSEKAALETSSCFAIEIGASIHYSDWDVAFTYDGNSYTPGVPIQVPRFTPEGGRLNIGNVDDVFTSLIINGTIKGESITVYEVFKPGGESPFPAAEVLFSGTIDGQSFTATWATLTVTPAKVQAIAQAPRRRIVPACGFVFKSSSCGYTGTESRCAKDKDTCLKTANFGGFRFVPPPGKTFAWGDTIYKVE